VVKKHAFPGLTLIADPRLPTRHAASPPLTAYCFVLVVDYFLTRCTGFDFSRTIIGCLYLDFEVVLPQRAERASA
jgi:hypothetical protein